MHLIIFHSISLLRFTWEHKPSNVKNEMKHIIMLLISVFLTLLLVDSFHFICCSSKLFFSFCFLLFFITWKTLFIIEVEFFIFFLTGILKLVIEMANLRFSPHNIDNYIFFVHFFFVRQCEWKEKRWCQINETKSKLQIETFSNFYFQTSKKTDYM